MQREKERERERERKRERERQTERERERVNHELRGTELVRTIIPQLVSTVAFFKGIF